MAHQTHTIKIEPLTSSAFERYGQVLGPSDRPMVKQTPTADEWRATFQVDGEPEIVFLRVRFASWQFHVMERHVNVTQAFFPLGGKPIIMVVAPPTSLSDWEAVPTPGEFRAFLTDGTQGVILHRGTWHLVNRIPAYPPHADIILASARDTTDDLVAAGDARGVRFIGITPRRLSQRIDYKERFGVTFELTW